MAIGEKLAEFYQWKRFLIEVDGTSMAALFEIIRAASESRIKLLSKRNAVGISPNIDRPPLVFGHWMSLILVSGRSLRITFKAHFMTEAAKFFAARPFQLKQDEVSQSRAIDFYREYVNLTAGNIKQVLAENKIQVGVSLPALARGFDDVFFPRRPGMQTRSWRFSCDAAEFFCSSHVELFEPIVIKKNPGNEVQDKGNVEYI